MVAGIRTKGEVGGKGWSAEPADEEAGEQEVVRNVNVLSVETGEQMELAVMAIRATSPSRTQARTQKYTRTNTLYHIHTTTHTCTIRTSTRMIAHT